MSWLTRVRNSIPFLPKRETAENLWHKCPECDAMVFLKEYEENLYVCPRCDHHGRIGPKQRFAMLLDPGYTILPPPQVKEDPLKFRDSKRYTDRLKAARAATGESDAFINARGTIEGRKLVMGVQDFAFMGGSMGMAVGAAFVAGARAAIAGQERLCRRHRRRRRADAGRHPQPDADAQGDGRDRRAQGSGPALYRPARRSDHRRSHRLLRDARRHPHRRARRPDRLRRPAGDRDRRSARSSRPASSAPNICASTAWSTWSSTGRTCARQLALLLDYLAAEPAKKAA